MDKMTGKLRRWWMPILFTLVGGMGGWLYYRFVGCVTGTCPIAANPYLMPAYGALIGLLLGSAFAPSKGQNSDCGPEA